MCSREDVERLYLIHSKKVWNVLRGKGYNTVEAEDILQDAFIVAVNKIGQLQNEKYFEKWLIKIAVRIGSEKARKRRREILVETYYGEYEEMIDDCSDKITANIIVGEVFEELPQVHKEILYLSLVADMSYKEIAKSLSISEGTVKSRISRAKESLRKNIKA